MQLIHAAAVNEGAKTIWCMDADIEDVRALEALARARGEIAATPDIESDDILPDIDKWM